MNQKKTNVAIVGLGFGAEFIPLWQKHPHTECHAICQRNEDKLKAVGDYFGVERRYTDFAALLKDKKVEPGIGEPVAADTHIGQGAKLIRHSPCFVAEDNEGARGECEPIVV